MRGNKGIFYCHLLPFVTTYCHKTAKNALISAISIDYFFKNVLIPSKNIAHFNEKCKKERKTYPHGHEHLCPRKRVLLTEYFGHKCLELRAQLCNVSGNIPRRLN